MTDEARPFQFVPDIKALVPTIAADSIISRLVHKDESANVTMFAFAAGQELTEHTASRPAILYFIEGKATLTLGDDEKAAGSGSWAYMEPHLPHSIVAHSPTRMLLILLK